MGVLPVEMKMVRGVQLRRDPARDACFKTVDTDEEMFAWDDMSPISRRERLHRHMNNEIGSLDIAAQCLADFPDAPWELRLQIARQCWDESRHVNALHRRLRAIGGYKGEFPISNFEWGVTCQLDSLVGRLAVQNRTFEAGLMDLMMHIPKRWREAGDHETADLLDSIAADEVQHVRFANQWIRRLAAKDRAVLLKVAHAVWFLARINAALVAKEGDLNAAGVPVPNAGAVAPINVEDRRLAEFTDDEIAALLERAGFRSVLPDRETRE
jgi:hypothetical protein